MQRLEKRTISKINYLLKQDKPVCIKTLILVKQRQKYGNNRDKKAVQELYRAGSKLGQVFSNQLTVHVHSFCIESDIVDPFIIYLKWDFCVKWKIGEILFTIGLHRHRTAGTCLVMRVFGRQCIFSLPRNNYVCWR